MNVYDYWEQELSYKFNNLLQDRDTKWIADTSNFTVVDGEEGDHGYILYYNEDGVLMCTKFVLGGDEGYIEFTKEGKVVLHDILVDEFTSMLDNSQHSM